MFLKMSLSGGILIILIIITRHIFNNHIPKRIFMFLWYIAALRLIIPVWLPFQYGILLPVFHKTGSGKISPGMPVNSSHTFSQIKIQHATDVPYSVKALNINLFFIIWITGAIAFFAVFIWSYFKECQIIREAMPHKYAASLRLLFKIPGRVKILTSDRITTPLASGIIHPGIIFPEFFKPDSMLSLKYIITHELIHIKRADNLWKIIILSTACLHWFNPLAWVMYILFNRDLEISCDEKVVSVFGNSSKKNYALALVNFAENQCKWQFFSNGFGKKPVQERIEAIMKYKKLTVPGAIFSAILLGAAVTVFAKGSTQNNTGKTSLQENINKTEAYRKEIPAEENSSQEGTWTTNNLKYFASTEDFKEYEKSGLSYNKDTCHLMYNGKIVGYFHDETSKNVFTHIVDEAGKIGIKVKRNASNEITGFEDFDNFEFISESYDVIEGTVPYGYTAGYTAIEENDINTACTISSGVFSTSTGSSSDEGNSSLSGKYKKYGITYDKSSDTLQYKGKNIAGLVIYTKPGSNATGKDNNTSVTEIYTNSDAGKESAYFSISASGKVKEITKKEFKKIIEG